MKIYGENLPKHQTKSYEEIAGEMGMTLTPEMRKFAWLVHHHALINFWASAARQMEFQLDVLDVAKEKEQA
jgi:uncharacterized protein (DUF697 family)